MKNLIEKNLSFRFSLTLVFSVTFIISLFTCIIIIKYIFAIEKELTNQLKETTQVAHTCLSSALWHFNNQYVHDFTDSLFLSEYVVYVKVIYDNKIISEKKREQYKSKTYDCFNKSHDFLVSDTEIYYQKFRVGRIQLAISKEPIKDSLWQATKTTLTLLLLIIIAILITTFFMVKKYFYTPVSNLENLMSKVSKGDTNIKFYTGKKDEIGRLSKKIDEMIAGMKKINASRDELNYEISERKKTEKALRASEERFREFVEGTDNLVTQLDQDATFIYVNPVAENVFGISQEDLKGMEVINFIHSNDREASKKWFMDTVKGIKPKSLIENRMVNAITGEITHWLWTANFFYIANHYIGVNCIGHNITKIKAAEDERAILEAQLRQAHKLEAVGTLAGGIAHDFNNILGIILGNAQLASSYMEKDLIQCSKDKALNKISEIILASQRAKDVVGQLLSFSRKNEIKKVVLKPDILIKESVKLLRASIESTIEIKLDIDSNIKAINAEPTQIHQVIINLCTNAAHSMEETGGTIVIAAKNEYIDFVKSDYLGINKGDYVSLSVLDSGHGIPQEIKEKIFDPYFTTKETGKGSGLGLAVTHGIVKSHNGTVSIKPATQKGTIVKIYLPATDFKTQTKTLLNKEIPQGKEQILFVDDEASLVMIAKEFLKNIGYSVDTFTNPVEALNKFKDDPDYYDLIVTDMTMPHMYGDKFAKEILSIRDDIPIFLCTGFSDKIDSLKAKEIGIAALLQKPVNNVYFAKAIRKTLDKREDSKTD